METFSTIVTWLYKGLATWYVAAIVGGLLMFAAERRDRRREPTDDDVRHAAALYREYYGAEAHRIIGDHMNAASFAPDGRHKRFLKRVSAELLKTSVLGGDSIHTIKP
ncbi:MULTISPECIES: hypothetical protein [unclassified Rhizobium]|uniref:hypothetical protein n=1 Tax=unclassified Rhizobium TaxID=2613769 RepID=UPI000701CBF4|nr:MULTISPECIES: hypothetical protein [unclassified Rhizobium]KQV34801.1 hypothetical protein ASC86_14935 [Rhizobium sp. Root1212]KRD24134.1 hypothetical protein ASE37_14925 [Rhizobium sp. Root268]